MSSHCCRGHYDIIYKRIELNYSLPTNVQVGMALLNVPTFPNAMPYPSHNAPYPALSPPGHTSCQPMDYPNTAKKTLYHLMAGDSTAIAFDTTLRPLPPYLPSSSIWGPNTEDFVAPGLQPYQPPQPRPYFTSYHQLPEVETLPLWSSYSSQMQSPNHYMTPSATPSSCRMSPTSSMGDGCLPHAHTPASSVVALTSVFAHSTSLQNIQQPSPLAGLQCQPQK